MTKIIVPIAGASLLAVAAVSSTGATERAVPIPAPSQDVPDTHQTQTAILAGGCFWGMEAVFEHVKGVKSVVNGYAGGKKSTATYAQVSSERTGHAEAVKIRYDPDVVSYGTLLRVYFSVAHDPTEVNRQGPDSGKSYRSAIFPQNRAQKVVAARYIRQLGQTHAFKQPIATKLEGGHFYKAEAHHQNFYDRNPNHPYIVHWDKPKVAAFRAAFPKLAT